jgi:hypothetical protein
MSFQIFGKVFAVFDSSVAVWTDILFMLFEVFAGMCQSLWVHGVQEFAEPTSNHMCVENGLHRLDSCAYSVDNWIVVVVGHGPRLTIEVLIM